MKRAITRTKDNRYCTVEIELNNGCLSICGEEGRIETPESAGAQALEYWRSYFEEPGSIAEMNKRMGTKFRSATAAAKYVLRYDGQYHGLDAKEVDDKVYILESCGQICEEIREWFPEVIPLMKWHLNAHEAGCEHQEALGWGHGKTIALTKDTLTAVQSEVIEADMDREYAEKIEKLFQKKMEEALHSDFATRRVIKEALKRERVTLSDMEDLRRTPMLGYFRRTNLRKQVEEYIRAEIRRENPPQVFDHEVFVDSLSAPCPKCGYKYGTQWLKRDLPSEIVNLAHTVLNGKKSDESPDK